MRTLALIAALLLLALQAPAELLQETAGQVPAPDQPEARDQGQPGAEVLDQPEAESQDVTISFAGDNAHLAQDDSGFRKISFCYCRLGLCRLFERRSGNCFLNGRQYRFCCR